MTEQKTLTFMEAVEEMKKGAIAEHSRWLLGSIYYIDDREFIKSHESLSVFKRLDWSEIEVDV